MLTDNRFIQIAYPLVIFFSLLLAWNSAGQVNGFDQTASTGALHKFVPPVLPDT
ncbi:MAG: hypothetical protein ACJ763_16585 [Bdellovibrionia bacterium]